MKPVNFDGSNCVYGVEQPEYIPLPAHRKDQVVTTCWELSFREAFLLLFRRKVWLQVLVFSTPLQPQKMSIEKPSEVQS